MDRFKEISSLVQVAQRGTLSAAARHEGVAPAIMTRRLDALEARLGVKLLQRTTRKVSLTKEGAAFVEDCQRVLRELEDAESAVAAGGTEARGHLRLTAPAGFGRRFIAPMVMRFARQQPRVNVSLDLSDRLVDLLAEGFDCAVRFGEQADNSVVRVPLGASRRVIVASTSYLKRFGKPKHPDDLSEHVCLVLTDGSTQQQTWTLQINDKTTPLRVSGSLVCNDGAALHAWTLAGLGLAWRSWWEVGDDVQQGRLIRVLPEFEAPLTPVYCVFPARKHLPLRVRLFVDLLRSQFADAKMRKALSGASDTKGA